MNKMFIAGVAVLAIAGSTAVFAQHRPWQHHHRAGMNSEDRAAFADARIAAVKAGLKLSPDQDKLWPPVEAAVRDFAKLRIDRANARINPPQDGAAGPRALDNPIARLQERAENMAATASAIRRIAEAADPLYKTLDDGQKRRLRILTRFGGGEDWNDRGPRRFERGMNRDRDRDMNRDMDRSDDRDFDRGPRGGPDRGFDRGRGPGPERL